MVHRASVVILTALLLAACGPTPVEQTLPANIIAPSATQSPTTIPAASTLPKEPSPEGNGLHALQVIGSTNWSQIQLLKTFPAEMPLLNSAVAISPDGKRMAVGSNSRAQIFFFDLPVGQLSETIPINGVSNAEAPFHKIEYLPDGTLMANSDGPYRIYHIDAAGNVLSAWDGSSFALSADRKIMAHGTAEGVTLVDIANNVSLGSFPAGYAVEYSFSPDGSKIAVNVVGVDYADTIVWDLANQNELARLVETGTPSYSPDGKFLAVTSYLESTTPLKIFSPDGQSEITTLTVSEPNGLNGRAALWSLDGSVLAAQIGNGPVVAWDTTSWQPLDASALQGELSAFSPDGRLLITRTSDGGILFWGIAP